MAITPTVAAAAAPIVVQLEGVWHMLVTGFIGLCAGLPLGAWFNQKGLAGIVASVKADVEKVKSDVAAIKTPATPVATATPTA